MTTAPRTAAVAVVASQGTFLFGRGGGFGFQRGAIVMDVDFLTEEGLGATGRTPGGVRAGHLKFFQTLAQPVDRREGRKVKIRKAPGQQE